MYFNIKTFKSDWKRAIMTVVVIAISISSPIAMIVSIDSVIPTIYKDLTLSGIEDIRVDLSLWNGTKSYPTIKNVTLAFRNYYNQAVLDMFTYYPRLKGQLKVESINNHSIINPDTDIVSIVYYINSTDDPLYENLVFDVGTGFKNFYGNECIVSKKLADNAGLKVNDKLNVSVMSDRHTESLILTIVGIAHLKAPTDVYPLDRYYDNFVIISQPGISKIYSYLKDKVDILSIYVNQKYLKDFNSYNDTLFLLTSTLKEIFQHTIINNRMKLTVLRTYYRQIRISRNIMFYVSSFSLVGAVVIVITTMLIRYHRTLYHIGLLKAIGFKSKDIKKIFLLDIAILGAIGTFLGTILGIFLSYFMKLLLVTFKITKLIFPYFTYDPFQSVTYSIVVVPTNLIPVAIFGYLVTILSGIYPTIKASKVPPDVILRPRMFLDIHQTSNFAQKIKGYFHKVYKLSILWRPILKGTEEIVYKTIIRRKEVYNAIILFLTISIAILFLSSSTIFVLSFNNYSEQYNQFGTDIYLNAYITDSRIKQNLTTIEGIQSIAIIDTVDAVTTSLDNVSQFVESGRFYSVFLKIINSSEIIDTLRWEYIKNVTIKDVLSRLDNGKNIIISRDLLLYLNKSIGDEILLKLSTPSNNHEESAVYYEDVYEIVGIFNSSIPGVASVDTVLVPKGFIPENMTISYEVLIKVKNIDNVNDVAQKVKALVPSATLIIPKNNIDQQMEIFNAFFALLSTIFSVTIGLVMLSLSAVLLTETIEQKYIFGIFRIVGYKRRELSKIIIFQSLTIVIISIIFGIIFGTLLSILTISGIMYSIFVIVEAIKINFLVWLLLLILSVIVSIPAILEIRRSIIEDFLHEFAI